jgi:hypothetical protein
MPEMEAAHIGPLPTGAFEEVLLVREGVQTIIPLNCRELSQFAEGRDQQLRAN